jgi:hypothetical protein
LFVANVLHPLDGLATWRLLNGDCRRGRCAMPMFLARAISAGF